MLNNVIINIIIIINLTPFKLESYAGLLFSLKLRKPYYFHSRIKTLSCLSLQFNFVYSQPVITK
jgi:hypothetical protein